MQTLSNFIDNVSRLLIQPLIILLVTAGVAYFIWGVAMFLMSAGDAKKRQEGTQHLIWGVVGVLIMVACIGILQLVLSTFQLRLPR